MPNELENSTSPYLRQHAENPVEWREWSEEAFADAKRLEKPVFLSIGYSTCHWCHVMEHESFEDPDVAAFLNKNFISIKVDREERPDLDATYMGYVQAVTGSGGWPMSVMLTPNKLPFFGGTYFPPADREGRAGFMTVLKELSRLWNEDRNKILTSAEQVTEHLRQQAVSSLSTELPNAGVLDMGRETFLEAFDNECGGFGGAPKFPRPVILQFLARELARSKAEGETSEALQNAMAGTLDPMAGGGMHDHLGGGFHRYSVDRYWHVPHFEKMLYDQALLMDAYLEAWQWSGEERYLAVSEGIAAYVIGELRDECGAFHAAEDADSLPDHESTKKSEGAFWTWTTEELEKAIKDPLDLQLAVARYDIRPEGNAGPESDPHGDLRGRNTLYLASSAVDLAERFEISIDEASERLTRVSREMSEFRQGKPSPHRDDKILAAWNGMMIASLTKGARILGRGDWLIAAKVAADFVLENLKKDGVLQRSWRDGQCSGDAFPLDYASMIQACIELAGTDPGGDWLEKAVELQTQFDERFWSAEVKGYLTAMDGAPDTLYPLKEDYDGAEPSPNSLAAVNLLKLHALTGEAVYRTKADELLAAASEMLNRNPSAAPLMLVALQASLSGLERFEWTGDIRHKLIRQATSSFLPQAVWLAADGECEASVQICNHDRCLARVTELREWNEWQGK